MNIGYTNLEMINNGLDELKCPVCGNDVYINKYGSNFACVDINCVLGHGANQFIIELNSILSRIKYSR